MTHIILFTGPRTGIVPAQSAELRMYLELKKFMHGEVVVQHGDCLGADYDCDLLCLGLQIYTQCRPGNIPKFRAHSRAQVISAPMAPMRRNAIGVKTCHELVACPDSYEPKPRSGTWGTIIMAQALKKSRRLIYPDGSVGVFDT